MDYRKPRNDLKRLLACLNMLETRGLQNANILCEMANILQEIDQALEETEVAEDGADD